MRLLCLLLLMLTALPASAQIIMRSDREAALASLRGGTNQIDSFMHAGRVKRYVGTGLRMHNRDARATVDFDTLGLVNRWAVALYNVDSNTFIRSYSKDFNSEICRASTRNAVFIYGLLAYKPHDLHVLYNLEDKVLQLDYVIPGGETSFRFAKKR